MTKQKVVEAVKELPPEFELEDLIERLILIEKVEKGLQQIKQNQTKSCEEAVQTVRSWQN